MDALPSTDLPGTGTPRPWLRDLRGRWVLVVGAGSVLGQALARACARRGCRLLLVERGPAMAHPPRGAGVEQRCLAMDPLAFNAARRCRCLLGHLGIRVGLMALCDDRPLPAGTHPWDQQPRLAGLLSWCGAFRSQLRLPPRGAVIVASASGLPDGPDRDLQEARRGIALDLGWRWAGDGLHVQSLRAPPALGSADLLAAASLDHLADGDPEVTPLTPPSEPARARARAEDQRLLRLIFDEPPRPRVAAVRAG